MKKRFLLFVILCVCILLCTSCSLFESNDPDTLISYNKLLEDAENANPKSVDYVAYDGNTPEQPADSITNHDIVDSDDAPGYKWVLYKNGELEISRLDSNIKLNNIDRLKRLFDQNSDKVKPTTVRFIGEVAAIPDEFFQDNSYIREIELGDNVLAIGKNAFKGMSSLKKIEFHSVIEIGESAFRNCATLEYITIPDRVTIISASAFRGCAELKTVKLPDELVEIQQDAFNGCVMLDDIVIPDSLTSIGRNAFEGCTGLRNLTIGSGVTNIGLNAFRNCSSLDNLVIKANVPSNAFEGNTSLTSVTFTGTREIGKNAFNGCSSIKAIDLGSGITQFSEGAFKNCSALSEIVFPQELQYIGNEAFFGCSSLGSISFTDGESSVAIGKSAFMGCDHLIDITFNNNIVIIGESAFAGCAVERLELPSSISSIGSCAFQGCEKLTTLSCASGSDIEIMDRAFMGCSSLKRINGFGFNSLGESAFAGCSKLDKLDLAEKQSVKLADSSFSGCNMLSEITKFSFSEVGKSAFRDCAIKSLVIPVETKLIKENAFSGCTSLTKVEFNEGCKVKLESYAFTGLKITSIKFPQNGEIEVGDFAFADCTALTQVSITGVKKLCDNAFNNCAALTEATIEDYSNEHTIEIGSNIFSSCSSISKLTLNCNTVGYKAFQGTTSLKNVDFQDRVRNIGAYAFSGCSGLTTIKLNVGIESIGDYSFQNCSGLTKFVFQKAPKRIGNYIWDGCEYLHRKYDNKAITFECSEPEWRNVVKGEYYNVDSTIPGNNRYDREFNAVWYNS